MLDCAYFKKRFSVGLALDTTLEEFNAFLSEYHSYIDNFYFSLPLGDKFHARTRVVDQMRRPEIVAQFWEMLRMIRRYSIRLELVLNNGNIRPEDVVRSAQMLREHELDIDLVGITDDIYREVRQEFPTQELVYSFKNRTNTRKEFAAVEHRYEEIVLGRQNIRNTRMFSYIRRELGTKVVLLLNNGCSHICGGCTTLNNCHGAYYRARFRYDPEYLYALQSILPYEIHSGLLDVSEVDLFKISSRNASVKYLSDCLDSYIFCREDDYIEKDPGNYVLWARLAWHGEFYDRFSLSSIREKKARIYLGEEGTVTENGVSVTLDLRNRYLFSEEPIPDREMLEQGLDRVFHGIPWKVEAVLLGASNCPGLLEHLDEFYGQKVLYALSRMGYQVCFAVPPLTDDRRRKLQGLFNRLLEWNREGLIDCVAVSDADTGAWLRDVYGVQIALGERMTRGRISDRKNDCITGNEPGFGSDLLEKQLVAESEMLGARFLLAEMPRDGLCVAPDEPMKLRMIVGFREAFDGICPLAGERDCHGECIGSIYHFLQDDDGERLVHCGNALGRMDRITDGIVKTVLENRVGIVVPPVWREML